MLIFQYIVLLSSENLLKTKFQIQFLFSYAQKSLKWKNLQNMRYRDSKKSLKTLEMFPINSDLKNYTDFSTSHAPQNSHHYLSNHTHIIIQTLHRLFLAHPRLIMAPWLLFYRGIHFFCDSPATYSGSAAIFQRLVAIFICSAPQRKSQKKKLTRTPKRSELQPDTKHYNLQHKGI